MPQGLGDPGHTTLARVRASRRLSMVEDFTGMQKDPSWQQTVHW